MTQEHPITPPDHLVKEWSSMNWQQGSQAAFADAARWGADQELEACCEWLETGPYGFSIEATAPSMTKRLRSARRTKPPSLKEQALEALDRMDQLPTAEDHGVIRRALEALPD